MTTLYDNRASGRLLFAILAADTEFILGQGEGEVFPDPQGEDFFWLTLDAGVDGVEIIKCINKVNDTLSVVRAQQDTVALDFAANTLVDGRLTSEGLMNFLQRSGGSMDGNLRMNGYSISGGLIDNMTLSNVALENFTTDVSLDIPAGIITMLNGGVPTPAGWAVCDGTNGTPDLQDKFIIGASATYPADATGGSMDYATEECGPHNHAGFTGNTALTLAQLPDVSLQISREMYDMGPGGVNPIPKQWRIITYQESGYHLDTSPLGGGGESHNHSVGDDGVHQHQLLGILPPYYAMVYIMKL